MSRKPGPRARKRGSDTVRRSCMSGRPAGVGGRVSSLEIPDGWRCSLRTDEPAAASRGLSGLVRLHQAARRAATPRSGMSSARARTPDSGISPHAITRSTRTGWTRPWSSASAVLTEAAGPRRRQDRASEPVFNDSR